MKTRKSQALNSVLAGLLLAASGAQAAQDISQKELDDINAQLAPVVNPQANAEKVGSPPEDPAAVVGSRFTYQGTLRLNNDRAQGPYDFRFRLYNQAAGGVELEPVNVVNDLMVTDGLFATELDFGDAPIDGDDIFLQIEVRDGASAGAYTVLSPRQRINATPYAVRAANGGGGSSVWTVDGSDIYYTAGNVGIGTASPAAPLDIDSNATVPLKINGGDRAYLRFSEQGAYRGYVGSWQTGTGTTDADFEIGTGTGSTGKMHITTQAVPRITVLDDGKVGIGTMNPLAHVMVDAPAGEDPLRVRTNGTSRLWVKENGDTLFVGNITQTISFGGAVKAAVALSACGGTAGSNSPVVRSFNGINSLAITATDNGTGRCIIDFPFNINSRFWVVSPTNGTGFTARGAHCDVGTGTNTDKLYCNRFFTGTGSAVGGGLMVLIY